MPSTNPSRPTPPRLRPQSRLSRAGRDGLPHGRPPRAGRPCGHGLQPQRAKPRLVCRITPRRSRPAQCGHAARSCIRRRHRVLLRRQRRRPAQRHAGCRPWRRHPRSGWRLWRHGQGAIFVDHTTASADVARELHAEARKRRPAVHRRAGVRRPGRRAERHADRDVRRRCGGFRRSGPGGHGLLARLHAAGRQRRRAAGQDGQPDLHRRPGAGPERRPSPSASAPAWT
jgi:hypothetical protein